MRILLVTHYYASHRGGVEIVAGELALRLAARGCQVTWAATGPAPGDLCDGIAALPMRGWNGTEERLGVPYPLWSPGSLKRLWRTVRRCDVVHLHDCLYLGNFVAYLAARLVGKPVVVTQHIGMVPYSRRVLRLMLEFGNRTLSRLVLGGSAQTIFISEKVRDYFTVRVRFRRAPRYVPNGVDTRAFSSVDEPQRQFIRNRLGWRAGQIVMLFVGRFVEKKGLPLLRRLAASLPACRFAFAGWGPDDPARWGLSNVELLGAVPHDRTPDYYRAADLLILPSVGEGFPLVVQEAMACGTPVLISSDTASGASDLAGVAYVSDIEFSALEALVKSLVANPDELHSRRSQVAQFARERWDWDQCANEYARLFERLVSEPGSIPCDTPQEPVRDVSPDRELHTVA